MAVAMRGPSIPENSYIYKKERRSFLFFIFVSFFLLRPLLTCRRPEPSKVGEVEVSRFTVVCRISPPQI
jgi:hypothetical protein